MEPNENEHEQEYGQEHGHGNELENIVTEKESDVENIVTEEESDVENTVTEEESEKEPKEDILKCANCEFMTERRCNLQQHINTFIECSECSKVFCGKFAKRQHKSHQKEHKPKKVFNCEHCTKSYPIKSLLKKHLTWSKCGRQ